MKKLFTYFLAALTVFIISGCGADEADKQSEDNKSENVQVIQSEETAAEQTVQDDIADESEPDVSQEALPEEIPSQDEVTEEPEEVTDVIIDDTNVFFAEYGKKYAADLDGDGEKEEIKAEKIEYNVDITIGENIYSEVFVYSNTYMSDYYCFVDINNSDSVLHLALQDYGPSDDEITVFYGYNGTELEDIGKISGVFDKDLGFKDATCDGNGVINSYIRFNIFQTWFGNADYVLEDGKLVLVSDGIYEALERFNSEHTLKVDLTVYKEADVASETVVLPQGTAITAIGSDNKEWVKITTSDNAELWIRFKKAEYDGEVSDELMYYYTFTGTVFVDGEKTLDAYEIFDGLILAD